MAGASSTMVLRVAEGSGSGSWASSPGNRKSMQGNRSRDTKPGLAVRSAVHRRGLRFRVSTRPQPELPRTADLVLRKSRIAVFVDGCYWHGCPDHHTQPATNFEYWAVGGHEILPSGGHVAARWRPTVLPSGGQQNCPR